MSELRFQPIRGRAHEILKAILQTPEVSSCSMKDVLLLRLACEEVVVNITSYAYPDIVADALGRARPCADGIDEYLEVVIEKKDDRIVVCFKDGGVPFNPLEYKNPDTKLSWKLRPIGGLGILLTINKMDATHYAYIDNQNVFTLEKVVKTVSNQS